MEKVMTMDDAFDARLRDAFAAAAAPLERQSEADAFALRVARRMARPDRRRLMALGLAGSLGAALAGSQLLRLVGDLDFAGVSGISGVVNALMAPESAAIAAMMVACGLVATILPRRLA